MNADEVREGWATRSTEYSPDYYAYYGPNGTSEQVRRTLDRLVGPEAAVLEVGCSAGRHLAHLHDHGYHDLHGLDINDDAFDVMAAEYPDLAAAGTFYRDAIEDVVVDLADGQFDAVFSVETLQHIHADATWVFAELARVTNDVLLTVECEGPTADDETVVHYVNGDIPLYYRPWNRIFTELGFVEVATEALDGDMCRVFRRSEDARESAVDGRGRRAR